MCIHARRETDRPPRDNNGNVLFGALCMFATYSDDHQVLYHTHQMPLDRLPAFPVRSYTRS